MEFLVIGFAPGLFWLWLIYQRDRYLPAPMALVVRTFVWGVVAIVPIALVELLISPGIDLDSGSNSVLTLAYVAFVVAGGVEELGKALVVRRTVFSSAYFRLPKDGLIFSAAAALGFASLENVVYMLGFGWEVILLRGPVSTLGHVAFAALWGAGMGYEKRTSNGMWTVLGLLGAIAFHGAFDFFLFTDNWQYSIGIFLVGVGSVLALFRSTLRESAAERPRAELRITCPNCGQQHGPNAHFCTRCGTSMAVESASTNRTCSNCGASVSSLGRFCVACGSRLVAKV